MFCDDDDMLLLLLVNVDDDEVMLAEDALTSQEVAAKGTMMTKMRCLQKRGC